MLSRRMRSVFSLSLLILAAQFAAAQVPPAIAPAVAPAAAPPAQPSVPKGLDVPDNALVAPGKAAEVELLYTGDVIGYIEPCG